ncbi:MAG: glycosyltransferase [Bacteroidota bacterium]
MKILILGAFDKGALEHYYVAGLQRCNAEIESFDITRDYYSAIGKSVFTKAINKVNPGLFFDGINKKLLQYAGDKMFDIILVFKGLTLYPGTIEFLKTKTRIICCYNPDHPFHFYSPGSGNSNIKKSISLYDLYFSYASSVVKELKKEYGVHSFRIPFGFDSTNNALPLPAENLFAGKWLFAGAYDAERAAILGCAGSQDLTIYGDKKWHSRSRGNTFIQQLYAGRGLYDQEYKSAIHASLGVINLLREQNIKEQSHNMRTFEVPGYHGLLISNRTEEQSSFFEEDKEAVYFETTDELKDKLAYLHKNPSITNKIKEAAFSRALSSGYSYTDRSREMYTVFENHLS